jgi:uncharacterized protein (DUF849 family)
MAERLPEGAIWQVIAIGRANLALTAIGLALGANVRVGMEDTLHLDRCVPATGNLPLVERAIRLATDLGRPVADVASARGILGLPAS